MAVVANYREIEQLILQLLGDQTEGSPRRPVAIAFLDAPPEGISVFSGSEPSSCSFWRLAAAGRVFYTLPSDHGNCPVGGYTHNALAPERVPELEETLRLMTGIGYIRMEDVPGVFHLAQAPRAVAYAPLGDAPFTPSVVLAAGKPGRVMMLVEAAGRAGAMSTLPLLGRPTCMALPAAIEGGAVASVGCVGNRVYTDVGDDEIYVVLRGADLEKIAAELETIRSANETLAGYHQERRRALATI